MSEQTRAPVNTWLRNRCLRAVHENNMSTLRDAFRKLTPAELVELQRDADRLTGYIAEHFENLPDAMKVSDRDE